VESWIEGLDAVPEDLAESLARCVAFIVGKCEREPHGRYLALPSLAELLHSELRIVGICGLATRITQDATDDRAPTLNGVATEDARDVLVPVKGIAEGFADVNVSEEIRGDAIAVQGAATDVVPCPICHDVVVEEGVCGLCR